MKTDAQVKPIFICGTGRSGTTIFTKLLGCHQNVWAFKWESQLFAGIPGLGDVVNSGYDPQMIEKFLERVRGHLFKRNVRGVDYGLFAIISSQDLETALITFAQELLDGRSAEAKLLSCKHLSDAIFLPPAMREGAQVWCEKTPRNILFADVIAKIYPEAKFINVVRDGRDVISSILQKKFWPVSRSNRFPSTSLFAGEVDFDKVAGYWNALIDIGREQEKQIGASRWINVRLEDIISDREHTFKTVFEFIEIDNRPDIYEAMHKLIRMSSVNSGRWKQDLSSEQIDRVNAISAENLQHFGYSVT